MNEYKEIIIDHYKNPRNQGELVGADRIVDEANSSCGDLVKIYVKFSPTSRKASLGAGDKIISEVAWRGVGCAISTAAASMLSERAVGMNKTDLEKLGEDGVIEMLGGEINAGRMKCATLAYRGLLKVFD